MSETIVRVGAISRRAALGALVGAALFPAACATRTGASIRAGSKNFTEELILGEMYAQTIEHAGYAVDRRMDLGSIEVVMAALQRGDVDVYPEYTGTALLVVLKMAPIGDPQKAYETVKHAYAQRFGLAWLDRSPMNDSQALATTPQVASKYGLRTLSDLARQAPQLRLAAVPEFIERPDGIAGLRKVYGGFDFKSVKYVAIGLKYQALLDGDVDVTAAFSTDGQIGADHLVVLVDDRHFWPPYQVAPVVRDDAMTRFPRMAPALNALAPHITDAAMRTLNWRVDGNKEEPADVARDFLRSTGLA